MSTNQYFNLFYNQNLNASTFNFWEEAVIISYRIIKLALSIKNTNNNPNKYKFFIFLFDLCCWYKDRSKTGGGHRTQPIFSRLTLRSPVSTQKKALRACLIMLKSKNKFSEMILPLYRLDNGKLISCFPTFKDICNLSFKMNQK